MAATLSQTKATLEIKYRSQSEKYGNPYPRSDEKRDVRVGDKLEFAGKLKKYIFKIKGISESKITFEPKETYSQLAFWKFDAGKVDNPHKLKAKESSYALELNETLLVSEEATDFEGRKEILIQFLGVLKP